jgi:putative intracellular protease/amidase
MKIAILVADGFEQVELTEPRKALEEQGAETRIVSPAKGQVQAWKHFGGHSGLQSADDRAVRGVRSVGPRDARAEVGTARGRAIGPLKPQFE